MARMAQGAEWHQYENGVPSGSAILDVKFCEFCGHLFLRKVESEDKYCSKCLLAVPTLRIKDEGRSESIH